MSTRDSINAEYEAAMKELRRKFRLGQVQGWEMHLKKNKLTETRDAALAAFTEAGEDDNK